MREYIFLAKRQEQQVPHRVLLGTELYFTTEVRKLILEAPRKLRAAQTNNVSSHAFPGLLSKDYMPSTLLSPVMRFKRNKTYALCPHESYRPSQKTAF